jgi:hypothetical protein
MRAIQHSHRRKFAAGLVMTSVIALSILGGGSALGADSRHFSVTVSNPSTASRGGSTVFTVRVDSLDNQTIANVHLSIPAVGSSWPNTGLTVASVFGEDGGLCDIPTTTSVSCDLGNIAAFDHRQITVLVNVASTVPVTTPTSTPITFSASAETNNENGSNLQVERGTSGPLTVVAANANGLNSANETGQLGTSALGTTGAGNLQTTLNLLQDNGGNGNVVIIAEGTTTTQPAVCVSLKLTCQPDFVDLTVNQGAPVAPYLETILTAKVPSSYNIKKAFVIHVLTNGNVDTGFPLFNSPTTSCAAHPNLVPCADFSQTKAGIVTITVHSTGNGGMKY